MEELVIENFNDVFKEVNLDTIEKKIDDTGFGDMLTEMRKKRIIENILHCQSSKQFIQGFTCV